MRKQETFRYNGLGILGEKMNLLVKATKIVEYIVSDYLREGDLAVDATCGNGNDALMLAELVGENGKVVAFDIQQGALEMTQAMLRRHERTCILKENQDMDTRSYQVDLILDSHENMAKYIEKDVASVILFNLGYLPGGEHHVVTKVETTLMAVQEAVELIRKDGLVAVTFYPGHPEGFHEKEQLSEYLRKLDRSRFHVVSVCMVNQEREGKLPPEIVFITKKK